MHRGRPFIPAAAQRRKNLYQILGLLGVQIAQMDRKPPVTLGLLAANLLFYWQPEELGFIPTVSEGCLQPYIILQRGEWWRMLWSGFLHADEGHVYYNMASLLWKGAQLEPAMGSLPYAGLVAELLLLSNGIQVLSALALAKAWPSMAAIYYRRCTVGFSGVLFALKVVLTSGSSGWTSLAGIPLPSKYLCWGGAVFYPAADPERVIPRPLVWYTSGAAARPCDRASAEGRKARAAVPTAALPAFNVAAFLAGTAPLRFEKPRGCSWG
eukprot:jgi/Botrbrau1/2305/Bobra.101_2s0126.1